MLHVTPITDCQMAYSSSHIQAEDLAIIRPMLDVTRDDIQRYCDENDLAPRFDRSNLDTTHFRNRLRHEVLPLLSTYSPNIRDRLRNTAAVITAEHPLLTELTDRAWAESVRAQPEGWVIFDRRAWRALGIALQRSTLRRAICRLRKSLRNVEFVHIEHARRVGLRSETGAHATLPRGLSLTVGYDYISLGPAGEAGLPPDEPLLTTDKLLPVALPGATRLPETGWTLHTVLSARPDAQCFTNNPDPWTAYVDADALGHPLSLRRRRRGDRFRPHGLDGHTVKVGELMIDLKIPRAWRDQVPLLISGENIIWLCGYRIGQDVAVSPTTQRVAQLRFRHSEVN